MSDSDDETVKCFKCKYANVRLQVCYKCFSDMRGLLEWFLVKSGLETYEAAKKSMDAEWAVFSHKNRHDYSVRHSLAEAIPRMNDSE